MYLSLFELSLEIILEKAYSAKQCIQKSKFPADSICTSWKRYQSCINMYFITLMFIITDLMFVKSIRQKQR